MLASHIQRLGHWIHTYRVLVGVIAVSIFAILIIGFIVKTSLPAVATPASQYQKISQPVVIKLSQKLAAVDTNNIKLSPKIEGSWKHVRKNPLVDDQLVFTPKSSLHVNTTYTVSFPSIKRLLYGSTSITPATFTTEGAPNLAKKLLATYQDRMIIPADFSPQVEFSGSISQLRHLTLRSTPKIDFVKTTKNDQLFTWKPASLLPQGVDITLELYDEKNDVSLLKKNLIVAPEPTITTPLARNYIKNGDSVLIGFDQPMDTSTDFIRFDAQGKGTWKSATEYVFATESLKPNTTYSYEIKSGLRSKAGGIFREATKGTFATVGPVRVVATSPRGNNFSATSQKISITFDQPVDRASAEARLSASAGTLGQFSWQGNTMNAVLSNGGYQKTITITVAPGVINGSFGLPSISPFSFSFTTEVRTIRLAVPHYRQAYAASCTAASLRMILAYRGIYSDDMSIVTRMGYAPRSKDTSTNPASWDDPNEMFVGSVDGSISGGTGAGPDAPPVAKAARSFGRSATPVTGIDAYWIARQIYDGNPVVMFGANRNTGMVSWQTPSGGITTMNLTGHATTVLGVVGEADAPVGFWVSDPLTGGPQYWSLGAVAANIARDPYRQAVVVY